MADELRKVKRKENAEMRAEVLRLQALAQQQKKKKTTPHQRRPRRPAEEAEAEPVSLSEIDDESDVNQVYAIDYQGRRS
jgi:hypothetical protein